jgi:hypothetical protein
MQQPNRYSRDPGSTESAGRSCSRTRATLRHDRWLRPAREIRLICAGDGGLAVIGWGMQIGVIWVPADHWFNGPIEFITPKTERSVPAAYQPSPPAPAEESLATN